MTDNKILILQSRNEKITLRTLKRFFVRIHKKPKSFCWIYKGNVIPNGYGMFSIKNDQLYAHRLSYELFKGEIPKGFHIDHLCKRKLCVNPEHLEAVSQRENNRRSDCPSGINSRKTHCPKGHELKGDNLRQYELRVKGSRSCRICHNESVNERARKRKESLTIC